MLTNAGINNNLFWPKETPRVADARDNVLTQEDFFALLTQQLAFQDPTQPVSNDQMVAQMTSFTMADGIAQLNNSFNVFAESMTSNQALQASGLIGQSVLVQGNIGQLQTNGDVIGVAITEEPVQNMRIEVRDRFGSVVRVINAGDQPRGNIDFRWDGKDNQGNPVAAGEYSFNVTGTVNGQGQQLRTAVHQQINSISFAGGTQGIVLNLLGNRSIRLSDIIQLGRG